MLPTDTIQDLGTGGGLRGLLDSVGAESPIQLLTLPEEHTLFVQFSPPCGLFYVRSGAIERHCERSGRTADLTPATEGCWLGVGASVQKHMQSYTAITSVPSVVEHLSQVDWERLVDQHPKLRLLALRIMSAELCKAYEDMRKTLQTPAAAR
jgi:CRP-like cAMP-binding protein